MDVHLSVGNATAVLLLVTTDFSRVNGFLDGFFAEGTLASFFTLDWAKVGNGVFHAKSTHFLGEIHMTISDFAELLAGCWDPPRK